MNRLILALGLLISNIGYTMTFEQIMAEEKTVVRFTATWCPPCKALKPIFEQVAAEHPEMKTYTVDVDENPGIAEQFGIKGIPTMLRLENGEVKDQKNGAQPKEEVEKLFK